MEARKSIGDEMGIPRRMISKQEIPAVAEPMLKWWLTDPIRADSDRPIG